MKTKLLFLLFGLIAITVTAQHDDYWVTQNTNFTANSSYPANISIANENVVWMTARDGSGAAANLQEFSKTVDGGDNWVSGPINVGDPTSGIAMIQGMSETTAWLAVYGNTRGIYKTTDGGTTWTNTTAGLFSDGASFPNVVHFWDENKGFCQGDPVGGYYEIYTTDDGGANWTRVPQANIPDPLNTSEYGIVTFVWTAEDGLWWGTGYGRLYRSYDFGHTFEVFQTPLANFGGSGGPDGSGDVAFANNTIGYLVDENGLFWTTDDGGETFNLEFPGGDGVVMGGNVEAIPGTETVVTTSAFTDGKPLGNSISFNAGVDFQTINIDENGDIVEIQYLDVSFLNASTGWAGAFYSDTDGGGVYKYIGPSVGVSENHIDGLNAYPNPVIDNFNIVTKEKIANIRINNVLGQEIYSASPNTFSHVVDMSSFPQGTYFVTVKTIDGSNETLKVIR